MEITTKFIKNAKSIRKWKDLNKDDKKLFKLELSPLSQISWDDELDESPVAFEDKRNKTITSKIKNVGSRLQLVAGKRLKTHSHEHQLHHP